MTDCLRMHWTRILTMMCAAFLWAGPVAAQEQREPPNLAGKVQVTPYAGFFIVEDQRYDNAAYFGARVGTDIARKYSIEGGLAYAGTTFRDSRITVSGTENVSLLLFFADFLYNYPLSPTVIAYGSFGVGGLGTYPEKSSSRGDAFFSFGGGLKVLISPRSVLRFEVRQYSPDFDFSFFNPRTGTAFVQPSGSGKADIQKILTIVAGYTIIL